MRINKLRGLNDYLISLLIHAIAIFLLGFITVQQAPKINELLIDWVTQETPEIIQEDFAPAGSPNVADNTTTQSQTNQAVQENPLVEKINPDRNVASSIEPPVVKPKSGSNTAPTEGTGSTYLSGVVSNLGSG